MTWRTFAACASFVLGGILLMSACGSSSGKKSAATTASPSGGGGTFEICTDPEDPPFESMSGGKYVGADIEFGQKVATALGKTARFTSVGFDGLIAAVQSHKCDAIISAMSDTPERAKQVTFVDYVQIPQATMIRKSNTEIKTLADLSGKTVSVLVGTTNKDELDKLTRKFKSEGRASIHVQIFNADTDAANAVATNKVDAWASDYPFCKEYVDRNPSQFKLGPEPPIVQPWGIAVAKTNTQLAQRLTSVVKNLYATGWMQRLLAKYHFSDIALKNLG